MTKQIWLNLPVKDVAQSKQFFTSIGFSFNEANSNDDMACMQVGEQNFVVMLFKDTILETFSQHPITDTSKSSEMMISFDAESRKEVDAFAEKVKKAGGNLFAPPDDIQGWMYGCAFADLDGHRWNILYMDFSKMTHN
ncbi:MAG: VOC family protein [Bacteroidota bacterium]